MRVAICDDDGAAIEKTERALEQINLKDLEYDAFGGAQDLLHYMEVNNTSYHLYILDIEMPDMTGLALAAKLRENDSKALFVFLTSFDSYMSKVFQVITFDFITKPITKERLEEVLTKAEKYLKLTNQVFSCRYCKEQRTFDYDEILYFEKRGRQAIIHLKDTTYQTNMTNEEIWKQLDPKLFATIHGSYIVNIAHIRKNYNGELTLVDGTELLVTKGYRKELAEKQFAFAKGGM